MGDQKATLESVLSQALELTPRDKARLIERVAAVLERELLVGERKPPRSLHGILKDFGPAPSAEEIDEARRELWGSFPRSDST